MALSNLRTVSSGEAGKAHLNAAADVVLVDNPDSRILPELNGWLDAASSDMYFMLTLYPNTDYQVSVDTGPDTLVLKVRRTNRPTIIVGYWAVNMGEVLSGVDWKLDFDVYNEDFSPDEQYTGKWKFSKGKADDEAKPGY